MHFTRKFSWGPQIQEGALLELCSICLWEYNQKPSGSRKETTEPVSPFRTMPQVSWHPGKGAKPDRVIQLNCGEVHIHASYKTNRTWENLNNQGTKMILLLDEIWLISNNSKSFANGSRSIIRNNLGLCNNTLKFTLFRTFKYIVMDLMV